MRNDARAKAQPLRFCPGRAVRERSSRNAVPHTLRGVGTLSTCLQIERPTDMERTLRGLSVRQVARALSLTPQGVRLLIHEGALPAANVAASTSTRPRFVVAESDLAAFWKSRRTVAPGVREVVGA